MEKELVSFLGWDSISNFMHFKAAACLCRFILSLLSPTVARHHASNEHRGARKKKELLQTDSLNEPGAAPAMHALPCSVPALHLPALCIVEQRGGSPPKHASYKKQNVSARSA